MKKGIKKIMALLLSLAMMVTMIGVVSFADESTTESGIVEFDNDGTTTISDASFDKYFEGTAADGVKALLDAGKCYINGVKIPQTETEKEHYEINWVDSLYKTDTGWGYNVHKTTSANTLTFEEARLGLFNTTSTVRGHKTYIYLDDNGICEAINIESFEVVRIARIDEYGNARSIGRGDFDLETNRIRYDVENGSDSRGPVQWLTDNFDSSVQVGDIAVYWFGSKTPGATESYWYLVKATPVVGQVTSPSKGVYKVGDWQMQESNVSRYNLIDSSRPTQAYTAYTTLGLTDESIVLWNTPNGMPIGFTFGETQSDSRALLKKGVANAQAFADSVTASEDGEDVDNETQWATQEDIDTFNEAIAAANKVAKANASTAGVLDWNTYQLSLAWKTFEAAVGYGELEPASKVVAIDNDGTTTISDSSFDEYFEGTAADGVKALLAAGKVSINGIAIPAEEPTEVGYEYDINLTKSLYLTDTGWGYNVHKTTSANTLTFEEARLGMANTTSSVRGHKTYLTIENGICTAIDMESYEVMKIVGFTNDGTKVTNIDRGDFALETNRVRYDANNIELASDNFDSEIAAGDVVCFWYTTDGWHMVKALSKTGVVTSPSHSVYSVGNFQMQESNVSRYNLIDDSRPTQGFSYYTGLGLQEAGISITLWCTPNEMPIGFSLGDNAAAAMAVAIENVTALKNSAAASEDGEDIEVGTKWATQEAIDTFAEAIEAAQTVADDEDSESWDLEKAMYTLYKAQSAFEQELGDGTYEPIETGVKAVDNDGTTTISDSAFDKYFEGTAADGVKALLAAGKVSINGIAIPAEEPTEVGYEYDINLTKSLYLTDTGWGYNVHKTTSANTLTFEEARLGMANTTSSVRGHKTYLTLDDNGICTAIDMESYEVMKIVGFENDGTKVTKIDRGDFALETNRVRYDANNIELASENFDSEIEVGDVVCFWYTTDGWHMIRALSKTGVVTSPSHSVYSVGNFQMQESNVSRYNLIDDSRPTQGFSYYTGLGLQEAGIEITLWCTPNEMPIGFSLGDNAGMAMATAIGNANEYAESVAESEDGEDVPSNKKWAAKEDIETFKEAIAAAKAVSDAEDSESWDLEKAMYTLYKAWTAFTAATADGEGEPEEEVETGLKYIDNDGTTTISDSVFDKYFEGTAAEGVQALLNAGKVSINGIPVPAAEDETTEYQINLTKSLYLTDTGWGYNVHKTTSANTLGFEEARTGMVNTTSSVRGHQTILTLDENGICTAINMESFEVMKITYFEDHGGNVDKIDRGDFDLETNRVRYDANLITGISSADGNFDTSIEFGDVVYFWYGIDDDDTQSVWHMYKADSITGVVTQPEHSVYAVGDWSMQESNVSRYNLIDDSRPTQGYTAYTRLGIQDAGIAITLWNTPNGMPIGFSYGANAKAALKTAVSNAEAYLASVVAAEDGERIMNDQLWATQDAIDTFAEAIAAAKAISSKNSSTNWAREAAIYALSKAWGDSTSGFTAEVAYGDATEPYAPIKITKQPSNIGEAVGNRATLSVTAEGEGLTYQWMYSKDGGETWITCSSSGSKKATFTFLMYKNFAGRTYRCVITDAFGAEHISNTADLSLK